MNAATTPRVHIEAETYSDREIVKPKWIWSLSVTYYFRNAFSYCRIRPRRRLFVAIKHQLTTETHTQNTTSDERIAEISRMDLHGDAAASDGHDDQRHSGGGPMRPQPAPSPLLREPRRENLTGQFDLSKFCVLKFPSFILAFSLWIS